MQRDPIVIAILASASIVGAGCDAASSGGGHSPVVTEEQTSATTPVDAASSTPSVPQPTTEPTSSMGAPETSGPAGASDATTAGTPSGTTTSADTGAMSDGNVSDSGVVDSGASEATSNGGTPGCEFTVSNNAISAAMATVGVVEWALAGEAPTSAKIVYELVGATPTQLNLGGEAPVDLGKSNYRTLLLGLKQNSAYTFRIEAVQGERTCVSPKFSLPMTGRLDGAPIERAVTVEQPEARTRGFILTPGGYTGNGAYVLDADGAVVWYVPGPVDPGRMHMDYEGENMWIMSLNPIAGVQGHFQVFAMDGQVVDADVPGFEQAHHDFTVLPGGKIATMVWRLDFELGFQFEPESDLVIRSPDGTLETPFKIGSNLYSSDSFHCNALHYIPEDDSFTISDRGQALVVNVSAAGEVQWQLGGNCADAPAGEAKCYDGDWADNHGHHLLSDGTFLLFNNSVSEETNTSRVFEFDITASADAMTATPVEVYMGTHVSGILGDVQRLPNGHTLITYSSDGKIVEVDADWNVVQTITGNFGYAEWRPTLYGAPERP